MAMTACQTERPAEIREDPVCQFEMHIWSETTEGQPMSRRAKSSLIALLTDGPEGDERRACPQAAMGRQWNDVFVQPAARHCTGRTWNAEATDETHGGDQIMDWKERYMGGVGGSVPCIYIHMSPDLLGRHIDLQELVVGNVRLAVIHAAAIGEARDARV
ncbi:hypothetical protein Tdes44962_MAKER05417 [Teratosphaeria destructans]|uniref:Uncharacterized protein n=1 Tax=Teratosphaeria destructans TaxID=418781 RepID=A0A9W7SJS1_9PEZI|nr:hypothetical protein Tdes44962_MAKER05417 [Teratosphaeria destructans]